MKSTKSISRFTIETMIGNAIPYAVKLDGVQIADPFEKITDAIEYIHSIVNGFSFAEVEISGLTNIPEESGYDDVILTKVPSNPDNMNVSISGVGGIQMNYRGMNLKLKIKDMETAITQVKTLAELVKSKGGRSDIVVECGPIKTKVMGLAEFEAFTLYLAK